MDERTRVQTFGPKEVVENGLHRYEYYAEAVGTDGRSYYATGRGLPDPRVEVQEELRERTGIVLEEKMRERGIWA